jgi:hypothetical protein
VASTGTALAPDARSDLGAGVLVETHLLARVAGIRLLRVDGVVTLTPARLVASAGDGLERAAHLLRECDRRHGSDGL